LQEVSFEIEAGALAFIGPSGSGNRRCSILLDVAQPTSGELHGRDGRSWNALSRVSGQNIGFIFQSLTYLLS
jgi:ABC-type lipoprotein export system ATPase subunit